MVWCALADKTSKKHWEACWEAEDKLVDKSKYNEDQMEDLPHETLNIAMILRQILKTNDVIGPFHPERNTKV